MARVRSWDSAAPYVFLAPFLTLFLVFTVIPSLATFVLAWFESDPLAGQRWIGSANFERLLGDPRFWTATRNTLGIAALATVAQVTIGLGLAHALRAATARFAAAVRVSLLVPFVTSGAAVAILAAQLVDGDYGLLPAVVEWLGGDRVDLLTDVVGSWAVVATMVAWRWFGFTTLLIFAVLDAVPRDLYRAAQLDGANAWAQFRHLSLPLLGPAIAFSVITSIVGTLQLFTEPLLVDPGSITCGPARQCQTLALLVYETGFRDFQFGYAAAIASTVFLITAVLIGVSAIVFRRVGRTV